MLCFALPVLIILIYFTLLFKFLLYFFSITTQVRAGAGAGAGAGAAPFFAAPAAAKKGGSGSTALIVTNYNNCISFTFEFDVNIFSRKKFCLFLKLPIWLKTQLLLIANLPIFSHYR